MAENLGRLAQATAGHTLKSRGNPQAGSTSAWKIVEQVAGQARTLFHGINGSRALPQGQWLEATEKRVRDGTGNKWYTSGFHVFTNQQAAQDYLKRFTCRTDKLKVIECQARGLRDKAHSPSPVKLAKWIRLAKALEQAK